MVCKDDAMILLSYHTYTRAVYGLAFLMQYHNIWSKYCVVYKTTKEQAPNRLDG